MFDLCPPAILNVGFSLIQIVIDIYKFSFANAFLKFLVMIILTIILNILCKNNLTIISWFIVFIPFIFMTIISISIVFVLGNDYLK